MQTLTVLPIEHIDVRGKTKFYLRISNDVDSYVITVGQRTIDECKRMQAMKPQLSIMDVPTSMVEEVLRANAKAKADGNKG